MTVERLLLGPKDVIEMVNLSRSTIYRKVQNGEFPAPLNLGGNARRWRKDQIEAWIDEVTAVA